MIVQALTLMATSGFAIACADINIVEQPARLPLDPAALLSQWRVSYHRGARMQLSLAIVAAVLAMASYAVTRDGRWLVGAVCLLAIAPYTLLVVMPVNRQLSTATPDANGRAAALVRSWGRRHAARGALGFVAALVFLWAMA